MAPDGPLEKRGATEALAALAGGATVAEAAKMAGVGERTVKRWRSDAGFKAELRAMRRDALDRARAKLAGRAADAADRVAVIALDPGPQSPAVRLSACVALLRFAREMATEDLEARVEALEEQLGIE